MGGGRCEQRRRRRRAFRARRRLRQAFRIRRRGAAPRSHASGTASASTVTTRTVVLPQGYGTRRLPSPRIAARNFGQSRRDRPAPQRLAHEQRHADAGRNRRRVAASLTSARGPQPLNTPWTDLVDDRVDTSIRRIVYSGTGDPFDPKTWAAAATPGPSPGAAWVPARTAPMTLGAAQEVLGRAPLGRAPHAHPARRPRLGAHPARPEREPANREERPPLARRRRAGLSRSPPASRGIAERTPEPAYHGLV